MGPSTKSLLTIRKIASEYLDKGEDEEGNLLTPERRTNLLLVIQRCDIELARKSDAEPYSAETETSMADDYSNDADEDERKPDRKNKYLSKPLELVREGTRIVLPTGMETREAITVLTKRMAEDEQEVAVFEQVDAYPLDGAIAFSKALQEIYGWATPIPTPGFFGPNPPTTVDVEIGYKKHAKVVWGRFQVPGVAGYLETHVTGGERLSGGRRAPQMFTIGGAVKKKSVEKVARIAALTRSIVETQSIYKGKAIRVTTDDSGSMDVNTAPTFLNTAEVNEKELIFPENVMEQVTTSLFTPIERTAICREHHIPLKRGILLEGKYGTGKTLTAYVTAKKCEENGWTFIYLDRVSGLRSAIQFANRYLPAVIFAEDIDRITSGERDVSMDDVLNIIDGVDSKNSEIITILTTNFVENIDKAMIRPGRLDAVISVTPPDAFACERLMRLYGRTLISFDEDLTEAGALLAGQIPAVIREVVERSKLYAISHLAPGEDLFLTGRDLALSARGMTSHLALLAPRDNVELTDGEKVGRGLIGLVTEAIRSSQRIETDIPAVYELVDNINNKT